MDGFNCTVGNGMLDLCMGKIYHEPLIIYREYIQNACDSLDQAVRDGLISESEKEISILINEAAATISINDRGVGVKRDEIGPKLVNLASSEKYSDAEQIGRYGIGRLVASSYCDKIIFETSAESEDVKSILTFDAKKAREEVKANPLKDCGETVDLVTTLEIKPEEKSEHYFRVTLINVNNRSLLDENNVQAFIAQTAPIDYEFEFKPEINRALETAPKQVVDFFRNNRIYHISINEVEIRKPYNVTIDLGQGKTEDLGKVVICEIKDQGVPFAYLWYAMTLTAVQMNDVPFRGIRIRKHNMAIGNDDICRPYFPKPVDANYFVGEIFIVHNDILPSGSRDGLTDSEAKRIFDVLIKKEFKTLKTTYETLSKINKNIRDYSKARYQKKEQSALLVGENDNQKKAEIQNAVRSADEILKEKKKNIQDIVDSDKCNETVNSYIEGVVQHWEEQANQNIDEFNGQGEKDKRINRINLKNEIEKIIEKKDEDETSPVKIEASGRNELNDVSNNPLSSYSSLNRVELNVIKKVYKVLDGKFRQKIAPSFIEEIKQKLVKEFTKRKN